MAKLNLTYYTEKDFYSDGDVEDEILELAKQNKKLSEIPNEECSYPVVYHLSKERENVLAWYPFKQGASVLEIGAGCGAITGLLCEKAEKVTAVDLSKRRATINYTRHSEMQNLEIFVGNLNDMKFEHQYDYVVLNGVFEYAMSFTEGDRQYESFLTYLATFLKPDGVVLIAIENRLGLKYFAGAPEDHTEKCFVGLNQYQNNHSVRTFTKTELVGILDRCGFIYKKFYYPYPDYKFTNEIFTDESLEEQTYGKEYLDFNRDRVELFEESKVASTLAKEQVADVFSNSFLVETSRTEILREKEVVYAKMNRDRDEKFQIMTVIAKEDGQRVVYKSPLTNEAREHIKNIQKQEAAGNKEAYEYLKSEESEQGLKYEFLTCNTVDSEIRTAIWNRDRNTIESLLIKIYKTMLQTESKLFEYRTTEFQQVFGMEEIEGEQRCVSPANIDLICDNLFWENGKYKIIDCEWIFNFPVPISFIMWRNLNELYYKYTELESVVEREELHRLFDIKDEEHQVFESWNRHYTLKYVKVKQLFQYAKEKVHISLEDICEEKIAERKTGIHPLLYLDYGNGFDEKLTQSSYSELKDTEFTVSYTFEETDKIENLRWDPVEGKLCKCFLEQEINGEWRRIVPENAECITDKYDVFYDMDPRYNLEKDEISKELHLRGTLVFFGAEEALNNLLKEREQASEQAVASSLHKKVTLGRKKKNL